MSGRSSADRIAIDDLSTAFTDSRMCYSIFMKDFPLSADFSEEEFRLLTAAYDRDYTRDLPSGVMRTWDLSSDADAFWEVSTGASGMLHYKFKNLISRKDQMRLVNEKLDPLESNLFKVSSLILKRYVKPEELDDLPIDEMFEYDSLNLDIDASPPERNWRNEDD